MSLLKKSSSREKTLTELPDKQVKMDGSGAALFSHLKIISWIVAKQICNQIYWQPTM